MNAGLTERRARERRLGFLQLTRPVLLLAAVPKGAEVSQIRLLTEAEPPPPRPFHDEDDEKWVLFFAGEGTDVLDSQQMHGAMRSGVRVAEQVIERLKLQLCAVATSSPRVKREDEHMRASNGL